jgi:hypothetical protein
MSPKQMEVVQSWIFPRSLPGEKTEAEIVEGIRSIVASASRLAAENAELRRTLETIADDRCNCSQAGCVCGIEKARLAREVLDAK